MSDKTRKLIPIPDEAALEAIIQRAAVASAEHAIAQHLQNCHVVAQFPEVKAAVFGNGNAGLKSEVQDLSRDVEDLKEVKKSASGWIAGTVSGIISAITAALLTAYLLR